VLDLDSPDAAAEAAHAMLEAIGLTDTFVERWADHAACRTWFELSGLKDGTKYAAKFNVTNEEWHLGGVVVRADVVARQIRHAVRQIQRHLRLKEVDAKEVACRVIGFEPQEIKAARIRPEDDGSLTLEVDVHDSDWEPDFDVSWDEVLPHERLETMGVTIADGGPDDYAAWLKAANPSQAYRPTAWQKALFEQYLEGVHSRGSFAVIKPTTT